VFRITGLVVGEGFFCVMMLTPNLVLLGDVFLILSGLLRRPWVSLRDDSKVRKRWEGGV
jgi:hypothetical protein